MIRKLIIIGTDISYTAGPNMQVKSIELGTVTDTEETYTITSHSGVVPTFYLTAPRSHTVIEEVGLADAAE